MCLSLMTVEKTVSKISVLVKHCAPSTFPSSIAVPGHGTGEWVNSLTSAALVLIVRIRVNNFI